jgi:hypothetical protein
MGVAVGFRASIFFVESEGIGALGKFDANVVFGAFTGIVFSELGAKPASLDADHGIDGRVEIGCATEFFCSNLVLLDGSSGMFEGVMGEIPQELAERL